MDYVGYFTYVVPTVQRQACIMISACFPMGTKAQRGSVACLRTHSKQLTGFISIQKNTLSFGLALRHHL